MENFDIVVSPKIGEIDFNLDSLKESLTEGVAPYKNLVVTEDNLKESKADLATLRKVRTELDDKKKAVKKAFMEPYTQFENKVKECFAIIDEPIQSIDGAVKGFEAERKAARKEECRKIYESEVGEWAEFIPFDRIFNEKWLNATAKDKDIVDAVQAEIIRVQNDINAIHALGSEIEDECVKAYKQAGTITAAIQRNSDYLKAKSAVVVVLPETEIVICKNTVSFVVSSEEADNVAQMLDFAGIEYERR